MATRISFISLVGLGLLACQPSHRGTRTEENNSEQKYSEKSSVGSQLIDENTPADVSDLAPSLAMRNGKSLKAFDAEQQTYDEAMAEVDKYRADVTPFVTESGVDGTTGTVWLGDGINALNGERLPTCLNLATLKKQTRRLAQTQDTFEFVHNYYDYFRKISVSGSIGGSGTFPWGTIGASISASSDKQVFITKDDLVAVANFNYLREEQSVYNARPAFAQYFNNLVGKKRGLFRSLCGDNYTKSAVLGGSMRIVFSAKKRDNKTYQKNTVESTLNLGFTGLFSINHKFNFSKEEQEILRSYSLSMKCFTSGTKADICGQFGLNTSFNFDTDATNLQDRMNEARKRMAADVDGGQSLVIVAEKFADYQTPIDLCDQDGDEACPAASTLYYNYRPRLTQAFKLLDSLEKMNELCTTTNYWKKRCNHVDSQVTDAIRSCADSSTPCTDVQDRHEMDILESAYNPGSFKIWKDTWRHGDEYGADFKGGDISGQWLSNTFYVFNDIGWGRLNDKASSIEVLLAPEWTLRFWEHPDPRNRGRHQDLQGLLLVPNLMEYNDMHSAFELIPPADLGD